MNGKLERAARVASHESLVSRRLAALGFALAALAAGDVVRPLAPTMAQTTAASRDEVPPTPLADLALPDALGVKHALSDYGNSRMLVVAFLGTECPLARHYGRRLAEMAREYADREVGFVGVMSNRQDTISKIQAYARRHEIEFPLLKDQGNLAADQFGAERTPEVFVLDSTRRIRYRGRIDDQYGVGFVRESATRHDLREALDALLSGANPKQAATEVVGCLIGRVTEPDPNSPVTYRNQIAPLLAKHCVECHQSGEIGPFSLTTYEDAVGWAPTLEEVVRQGRMPPWHAAEGGVPLANTRKMTDAEKRLLYDWVERGAPEGDGPPPASIERPTADWRLPREPDMIIPMSDKPFHVPSGGVIEYQYFVVDPGFQSDMWVQAAAVQPGDRSVVHHTIVFVRPPDDYAAPRSDIGWLAGYVPGQLPQILPPHQGRLAPAGSKLVFQMHYTPNGAPTEDLTRLGLIFGDPNKIREQIITTAGINREFEIPPHESDYAVELQLQPMPRNARVLALTPHMHFRGKSFRLQRELSDGQSQVVLSVPAYDFNWQHTYFFADPLPVTQLENARAFVAFDNSEDNLSNPDPDAAVRWGDQSWQEMALALFELALPLEEAERRAKAASEGDLAAQREAANRRVDKLLKKFDRNGDGLIQRREAPAAFSVFAFHHHDADHDNKLTREEIMAGTRKPKARGDDR